MKRIAKDTFRGKRKNWRVQAACFRSCKIISIISQINSIMDLEQLLGSITITAAEVVKSETASLLLIDESSNELVFKVALGEKGAVLKDKLTLKMGEGVAGFVAETGKALIVNNASRDPRFAKRIDGITHFHTRAILCVPIKHKEHLLGVLEAINPIGRKKFSKRDTDLLEVFSNQAAIAIENARLHTDGLSRLFIREYFFQKFYEECIRFKRFKHPFSLIMIDIDHFKKINDFYGHPQGDIVIRTTALLLKNMVRQVDIPCRYGGDEFVVILPETSAKGAMKLAEGLRRRVEAFEYANPKGEPFHVTVSVGVVTCPEHAERQEKLIERADLALYASKNAGRNCCTLYSPELEEKGLASKKRSIR